MQSSLKKENGLLSDIQILERLVAEDDKLCIFVSPLIDPQEQLGASSLDMRLGTRLYVAQNIDITHIDLTISKEDLEDQLERYFQLWKVKADGNFVLHPGQFALAPTLEYIRLPRDIAGRLEGRSSVGRLGLQVHATAGFVDPGFEGALTFELINGGNLPVKVFPGLRLGQICFFRSLEVQIPYLNKSNNKYGRRQSVEPSKIHLDAEIFKE